MPKILVVVDMQNDFITGPLGNDDCRRIVPAVTNLMVNGGYDTIILTQDTHNEDYLDTLEGKRLPVPHCIRKTEGWKLVPEVIEATQNIDPRMPIIPIKKDTFGTLGLSALLEKINAIEPIIDVDFCGVCTGICVISNAMIAKATLPNANINVYANACACVTPASHQTALEAMEMCHINII